MSDRLLFTPLPLFAHDYTAFRVHLQLVVVVVIRCGPLFFLLLT
uniref:Uncharacterized protein n=1 Tax=Arundo donax TaxID=35708 RepID=A0A0A9EPE7_ARUDO